MALPFSCPLCHQSFQVAEELAQSLVTCPNCMQQVLVSDLETKAFPTSSSEECQRELHWKKGDIVGERYELQEKLGQGGMGVVYRARHVHLERWVAVKFLSSRLSREPQFRERFLREAKTLAALDHPHIVKVLDMGIEGETCYYVMEFVEGLSLDYYIKARSLSFPEMCQILLQVASGLEYAHSKGVVHRDMKPANVLVSSEKVAKIADFGLVRLLESSSLRKETDEDLTTTGMVLGTYRYMAPEQRSGEKNIDERADVYALGVMAYEMFTGREPVGRFAAPSEYCRQLTPEVDRVLLQMLEGDRERRLSHLKPFREALEALLTGREGQREAAGKGEEDQQKESSSERVAGGGAKQVLVKLALGSQLGCSVAITLGVLVVLALPLWKQRQLLRESSPKTAVGKKTSEMSASVGKELLEDAQQQVASVYQRAWPSEEELWKLRRKRGASLPPSTTVPQGGEEKRRNEERSEREVQREEAPGRAREVRVKDEEGEGESVLGRDQKKGEMERIEEERPVFSFLYQLLLWEHASSSAEKEKLQKELDQKLKKFLGGQKRGHSVQEGLRAFWWSLQGNPQPWKTWKKKRKDLAESIEKMYQWLRQKLLKVEGTSRSGETEHKKGEKSQSK